MMDIILYVLYFEYSRWRKAQREAEIEAYNFMKKVVDGSAGTYHAFQLDAAMSLVGQTAANRSRARRVKGKSNRSSGAQEN